VRTTWTQIDICTIESTPAHLALAQLIADLKNNKKEVWVYTDNIDGIHSKCNIPLSRDEESYVLYPNLQDVRDKKVVSLFIGQSFDFDHVLGHLSHVAPQTQFFSMNIKSDPIKVFTGIDANNLPDGLDHLTLEKTELPGVRLLKGTVQVLLPKVVKKYKKNIEKTKTYT